MSNLSNEQRFNEIYKNNEWVIMPEKQKWFRKYYIRK